MTDPVSQAPAGRAVVGRAPGQPDLAGHAGARALGNGSSVLPELAEAPSKARHWWRHPAFLVSSILTVLALGAAVAWWIVSVLNDDSVKVDALTISVEGGMAHLDWSGPDAAYALFAVTGDGSATDLTQWVRGTEAFVPQAAGVFDDATCFVVRPAHEQGAVSLQASDLSGQRGASACVADAGS
ncbi:hypothetical protein ET445_07045 [Agromyces protaetiae]|uniref:Uncharacterized protein n=1 Tax=Agromyces protaetiae TaxID=2509455 RepID=A0A4P6FFG1_9MICO|nr:hypothetical protein [Agromyces protaetiae]QAY73139.1 hypothetical protein ET445_07045 [Agromyces protaetiae]